MSPKELPPTDDGGTGNTATSTATGCFGLVLLFGGLFALMPAILITLVPGNRWIGLAALVCSVAVVTVAVKSLNAPRSVVAQYLLYVGGALLFPGFFGLLCVSASISNGSVSAIVVDGVPLDVAMYLTVIGGTVGGLALVLIFIALKLDRRLW